jgi:hypothetical protein
MPLVWSLLEHSSSRVGDDVDNALWDDGATLRPPGATVVLTADRGGAAPHLLASRSRVGGTGGCGSPGVWGDTGRARVAAQ